MGLELTQRRRNLFWELYSLDNWKVCRGMSLTAPFVSNPWKSLGSGRPPHFRAHEVNCHFPDDMEEICGKNGSKFHSCEFR